jgi:DNA repair photolyase
MEYTWRSCILQNSNRLASMDHSSTKLNQARKGRGATTNPDNRYDQFTTEAIDDGWGNLEQPLPILKTTLSVDSSRSMISYNQSPDVPFDRSINPYRGCEHGCIYCYARPTHAWLGHSPGLDFESLLYYKPNALDLLRRELSAKRYRCANMAIGAITDAYQPVERTQRLTRELIQLLADCHHPLTIITKSALVERDIDLLSEMAQHNLAAVCISITTLKTELARSLEPRAAVPRRRLQTIERLAAAGIPVSVLVAPVIPVLTDPEMETILKAARDAGATAARYILLRLPLEVAPLFSAWLEAHVPDQAQHVLARVRDSRAGELYRADFSQRMSGSGVYAEMLAKRFELATRKLGLGALAQLDCSRFRAPAGDDGQLSLL